MRSLFAMTAQFDEHLMANGILRPCVCVHCVFCLGKGGDTSYARTQEL